MAKECTICGKTSQVAKQIKKLRGKYNPTVKKRKQPNLQWLNIPSDIKKEPYKEFAGKRVLACAKCIKAMRKKE